MIASANAAGCLATSAAVTAAVRNVPAGRDRAGESPPVLYSPECVELEFCELRLLGILGSSAAFLVFWRTLCHSVHTLT
jgi:hypothetical protein